MLKDDFAQFFFISIVRCCRQGNNLSIQLLKDDLLKEKHKEKTKKNEAQVKSKF
jgi:hypothetical protein